MAYPRQLAALYQTELQAEPLTPFTQERWFKASGATVQSATQHSRLHLAGGKTSTSTNGRRATG